MRKVKHASEALQLEQIPNVGPATADDLRLLGLTKPKHLKGEDGIKLYYKLNRVSGVRHDPCVADVFMAAVDFMNGGKPRPCWDFTSERKLRLKAS